MSGLLPKNSGQSTFEEVTGDFVTVNTGNLNVTGISTLNTLTVNGASSVNNLNVAGALTIAGSLDIPGTLGVDTLQNHTTGGPLTLRTQTNNANIFISPQGTGYVILPAGGNGIVTSSITSQGGDSHDLTIGSNEVPRIVISHLGIPSGSSTTALTLNGTGLESNTIITPTGAQTLTNKTIDSANNTVLVNGTNINSLVNQDVTTTGSPNFSFVTTTGTESCDIFQNRSPGSFVTVRTTGSNADVLLAPNGTGHVIVGATSSGLTSNNIIAPGGSALSIGSNATTNLVIPVGGIASGTSTNVLALNGTSLETTTAIVTASSTTTLTNKTINSASNTIQVNGTNINSLINQDVRTTASPTFVTVSADTLQNNTAGGGVAITCQSGNADITLNAVGTGHVTIPTNSLKVGGLVAFTGNPLNFTTGGSTRLSIPDAGIVSGTSTNVLALNGQALETTTAVVTTTGVQTLTNKTIDSASNTIEVGGLNINVLIDQDVRTTSSPTFVEAYTPAVGTKGAATLSLVTNNTTRLVVGASGIPSSSTATDILVMNGTALETRSISSLSTTTTGVLSFNGFTGSVTAVFAAVLTYGVVTLRITMFSGTKSGAGTITSAGTLAASLRPPGNFIFYPGVINIGNGVQGECVVDTGGGLTFYADTLAGNFVGGSTAGINGDVQATWLTF